MWDLLRFAVALSIPIMIFGSLLWFLVYSAIRMALRHEISRAERRRAAARPAVDTGSPSAPRPRAVPWGTDGQPTRLRPPGVHAPVGARKPAGTRAATIPGQRRAAS